MQILSLFAQVRQLASLDRENWDGRTTWEAMPCRGLGLEETSNFFFDSTICVLYIPAR